MKHRKAAVTILVALPRVIALADDFKTVNGKGCKNAMVSFIAVKPWNSPDVTTAFDTEHKVSIQLRISVGELGTN